MVTFAVGQQAHVVALRLDVDGSPRGEQLDAELLREDRHQLAGGDGERFSALKSAWPPDVPIRFWLALSCRSPPDASAMPAGALASRPACLRVSSVSSSSAFWRP